MGASTGIVLSAAAISLGNEWIQTDKLNIRIGAAGLAASLILDGIERVSEQAATGLAVIMLITILVTPFNGKSPVESLSDAINGTPVRKTQTPAGHAIITVNPDGTLHNGKGAI